MRLIVNVGNGGGVKKTVLIVDDEEDLREIVQSHLEDEGYTVLKATDGLEGLEMVKRLNPKPGLIILDIAMPRMTGLEMLQQLRGSTEHRTIPVLILSAQGRSENLFEAERLRAEDFLIKPFTREDLLSAVRRALT
jgi:CheY-like chemotaxis protein